MVGAKNPGTCINKMQLLILTPPSKSPLLAELRACFFLFSVLWYRHIFYYNNNMYICTLKITVGFLHFGFMVCFIINIIAIANMEKSWNYCQGFRQKKICGGD
jgi:hypothetical protein